MSTKKVKLTMEIFLNEDEIKRLEKGYQNDSHYVNIHGKTFSISEVYQSEQENDIEYAVILKEMNSIFLL